MLFAKLDDVIELFKSKNPHYQHEKEKEQIEHQEERIAIRKQLNEARGLSCRIMSNQLIYISADTDINAKVIAVDDDWVELETTKKKKKIRLYLKVADITSVAKLL